MNYDNVIEKSVEDEAVQYGILYGNDNLIFIKTGAGGNIQGYEEKYLRMAHRLHSRLGATVICASNPCSEHRMLDRAVVAHVASEIGCRDYAVYLLGVSDGAYQLLSLAKEMPQSRKLLGINASLVTLDGFREKLQAIPNVEKLLVYGTEDDLYPHLPTMQGWACPHLQFRTVPGADHRFSGMVEEFIALSDLL